MPAASYTVAETQPFGDTTSTIRGVVFIDTNKDNVQTTSEKGLAGVTVTLTGTNVTGASVTVIKTTGPDGTYVFSDLLKGTYSVTETQPARYENGVATAGTAGGTVCTAPCTDVIGGVSLDRGTESNGYFFAEYGASLGDRVWEDVNDNGIQDAGERGLGGVTVRLFDGDGNLIDTRVTSGSAVTSSAKAAIEPGYYLFQDLPAGSYVLQILTSDGYVPSSQYSGLSDFDSDVDRTTGRTQLVVLASGNHRLDIDAGVVPPGSISGRVFIDPNRNGVPETKEGPAVEVHLDYARCHHRRGSHRREERHACVRGDSDQAARDRRRDRRDRVARSSLPRRRYGRAGGQPAAQASRLTWESTVSNPARRASAGQVRF